MDKKYSNTSGGPEIIIPVNDVVRKNQLGIDPIPNVVKHIFIEEGREKTSYSNSSTTIKY